MTDENIGETLENSDEDLKETLKKRLELELGLPLTPTTCKVMDNRFDDDLIMLQNFPVQSIESLKIDDYTLTEDDYVLDESKGIIYLKEHYKGFLYLEYIYCLNEDEFMPLLDLMVEYESDNGWDKNASSIKENNVTVSYDTSLGKGGKIQGMIDDLRSRYSVYVEMI